MKIFKQFTQSIITLTTVLTLAACGSGSEGLTIEADLSGPGMSLSKNKCIPIKVTRPQATESTLQVVLGRVSGSGSFEVYADSQCEDTAFLGLSMQSNTNIVTFYFKTNTAGSITLQALAFQGTELDMEGSVSLDISE